MFRKKKQQEAESIGNKAKKGIKNILFWFVCLFLITGGLVYLPSISSIFLFIAAVLLMPINAIQNLLKKVFPKKAIKGVLCAILAVVAIAIAPVEPSENKENTTPPPAYEQIEESQKPIETPVNDTTEPIEQPIEAPVNDTTEPTPPPTEAPVADEEEQIPENSTFEIHYLDVGQADAALVLCDGKAMLIDGGNSADSSFIYSYLKQRNLNKLEYIIATHGHEDHIGGLSGALNYATVETAYCSVNDYDSEAFEDFVKYLNKQNKEISIPKVGESFKLGSATVQIVGVDSTAADANNTSIVLRIIYGETSFLFTGDAERDAEQFILNSGYDIESTVLKVGHHGSESSTSYVFLREVAPEYAIISVGKGNSYGHPTEEVLSRLRDADVKTYRTDLQGTIICVSDGKKVSFTVSKNENADTLAIQKPVVKPTPTPEPEEETPAPAGTDYIGNKNTMKFHYPSCSSVKKMKESNKYYYNGTRDEMIAKGYKPCGNCHP